MQGLVGMAESVSAPIKHIVCPTAAVRPRSEYFELDKVQRDLEDQGTRDPPAVASATGAAGCILCTLRCARCAS